MSLNLKQLITVGMLSTGVMVVAAENPKVVVVTATRTPTSLKDVGSSISVITGKEIQRSGKTTVLEVLRTTPGVEIVQTGGAGKTTSVFLRGANSSHTLVLVDGVRMNSNTAGLFDLADLKADNIERIEILRGPQSTLYGSEAIGGVIHIFTKRGTGKPETSVRLEGGSFDFFHGAGVHRGTVGNLDYSLSASFMDLDGVSAASEDAGNDEKDGYQNVSTVNRFDLSFMDDGRADLVLRFYRGETDLDGFEFGVGPADDLNYTQTRETFIASLNIKKSLGEKIEQTVRVGMHSDELTGEDPDTMFNNYTIKSQILNTELQTDITLAERTILSVGYDYEQRMGENEGTFDEEVDIHSLFAQAQWSVNDLFLTAGVRIDDHSEFGDETTYRGTISTLIMPSTRLHSSIGTGFKAPAFNDLFWPGFGNRDLLPETSLGYDAGIEQDFMDNKIMLDLTYFHNEFDDLIDLVSGATGFMAVNVNEAEVDGLEASLRVDVTENLNVVLSYTLTDSEDKSTGALLARRPKHRVTLSSAFDLLEKVHGMLSVVVVNDRVDSSGSAMDDYERVDLSMVYDASDHVRPYIRIENLFDKDYEEVAGFTSPGISGIGGVQVDW